MTIDLVDTTVRDGNQSNWGATGLDTGMMLQIAPVMERVGFHAIDFLASTHMGVAVRFKKEDPWERLRLMRAACPTTPLQFLTTGMRFISWEVASDELMEFAFRLLVNNGIDRFAIMDPMNNVPAMLNMASLTRRAGGSRIVAALTFTLSPLHDDAHFAEAARALTATGRFDRLYLKDPGGLVTPERAKTLIPALKAVMGAVPLEFHSHTTIGLAPFSYLEAAPLGAAPDRVAGRPILVAREDQRHVDVRPCRRQFLQRANPGRRGGHLDHSIGMVGRPLCAKLDVPRAPLGRRQRTVDVLKQRVEFKAHVTVVSARAFPHVVKLALRGRDDFVGQTPGDVGIVRAGTL